MRIFCDVDDTIVLWQDQPRKSLYSGTEWLPNDSLLDLLEWVNKVGKIEVILWSAGGRNYAAVWARKLLHPRGMFPQTFDKDKTTWTMLQKSDMVIDDQTLALDGIWQLKPDDAVAYLQVQRAEYEAGITRTEGTRAA